VSDPADNGAVMGIKLSTKAIAQLQVALSVMLAPFSYEDGDAWRREVCATVEPLVGATASVFFLPLSGESFLAGSPEIVRVHQVLVPPPAWTVHALTERRRALGLAVADWLDLHDVAAVRKTLFYNEVVVPNRLLAPLSLTTDIEGIYMPAVLSLYFDDERKAEARVAERKQRLELLVPAFRSGVQAYIALRRQRKAFLTFSEQLHAPAIFIDGRGRTVHESIAFAQLTSGDPEGRRIREDAARVGTNLLSGISHSSSNSWPEKPTSTHTITAAGEYRVAAISLGESGCASRTVAVFVQPLRERQLDAQRVSKKFRLTEREGQAAVLLTQGMSGREIATTLGISVNTARRHTEQVLAKLGVHSRTAVVSRLRGS